MLKSKKNVLKQLTVLSCLSLLTLLLTGLVTADNDLTAPKLDVAEPNVVDGYVLPFAVQDTHPPHGFLTEPQAGDALDIALAYVRDGAQKVFETDTADLVVVDQYIDHLGVTHIFLRQQIAGVEVFGSTSDVHITSDGRIVKFGNRFFADIHQNANTNAPDITPTEAVVKAASHVGVDVAETLDVLQRSSGPAREALLDGGTLSRDDIPVKLMYHPMPDGSLRLVWDTVLNMTVNDDWWNLRVDALSGEVISKDNWTLYANGQRAHQADTASAPAATHSEVAEAVKTQLGGPVSYEVYPLPYRDPFDGPRQIVQDPADRVASPYGWHDTDGVHGAEYTVTWGNNVLAFEDQENNNDPLANLAADGGANLLFSFPINLEAPPEAYLEASITNLFYWNNIIHDIFYHYGFDEVSGNFQWNNYGNGGVGNDAVWAQAQDGGGFNNANFATPPDGGNGRMQMYLGGPDANGVIRDGSLDNVVVIHEYGHGISNRLVGGPSTGCLGSAEQGGEGWSDFFGVVLTQKEDDAREAPYPCR